MVYQPKQSLLLSPWLLHSLSRGGTIINTAMDAQQQRAVAQAQQKVDQEIDTIQLQQCTNFLLIPSLTYPGIRDIQVTVLAHVNTPEQYEVQANLRDLHFNYRQSQLKIIFVEQKSLSEFAG